MYSLDANKANILVLDIQQKFINEELDMYLLIVSYTQPSEVVAPHVAEHAAWVKKYVSAGVFLFAGPKKNALGGAILAKTMDKELLNNILAEDSYVRAEVCKYEIIDFICKLAAPELALLLTESV
jgi:uncharacterized protein YciI